MNPILQFLASLRSLYKAGVIRSVDQAMDFAKQQFGQIDDLFKRQIEEVFKVKPKRDIPPGGGGITSIKNAPKKQEPGIMDQIEGSGKRLEGAANRMAEIQKEIDAMYKPKPETSPLMERLETGIETLKQMKQPGMDLATGLTRTAARKILDRAGIQVPDKVDPLEVFIKEFGGEVLTDVKNVAEEMIELERMGKSLKSMDEILEQSGLFNIKRNPDAPKGISDEQLEQIKKEVDQEKQLEDFDPTDREPNSMGGLNRTGFAYGTGKSLFKYLKGKKNLIKKIKEAVNDIFTTGDPKYDADVAVDTMFENLGVDRDMFDQKEVLDAYGMAYDELKKPLLEGLKNKPKPFPEKRSFKGTEIKDPKFDENMPFDNDAEKLAEIKMSNEAYEQQKILDDVDKAYGVTPEMKKELDALAEAGAPKLAERFRLKQRYPGIDEDLLTRIIDDPDPQRKAEVLATLDQSMLLMREGKTADEAVDILKQEVKGRKPNARGGLNYLMGM